MGMAASQARFLGLTARKTNVEYEGQQVNQQRTALSNQSANYYNQMLGMQVPVPPSVNDFTKTVYSFNDGALENTITAMIAQGNGNYKVSYLSKWTDDFAVISAGSTSIVNSQSVAARKKARAAANATTNNNTYYVGKDQLKPLGEGFTNAQRATSKHGEQFRLSESLTYTKDGKTVQLVQADYDKICAVIGKEPELSDFNMAGLAEDYKRTQCYSAVYAEPHFQQGHIEHNLCKLIWDVNTVGESITSSKGVTLTSNRALGLSSLCANWGANNAPDKTTLAIKDKLQNFYPDTYQEMIDLYIDLVQYMAKNPCGSPDFEVHSIVLSDTNFDENEITPKSLLTRWENFWEKVENLKPEKLFNTAHEKWQAEYDPYIGKYMNAADYTDTYDVDNALYYDGQDNYLSGLTNKDLEKLYETERYYASQLNEKYGEPKNGWYVRYLQDSSTKQWYPVFYDGDDLAEGTKIENGNIYSNVRTYKIGSGQKQEEIKHREAKLEQDSTGRFINLILFDANNKPVKYSLTTNTTTDQAAYNDAMNQYEYDKYQYDQTIQAINAKIEIVQSEDKNLELRLKQLDTEQDAIQTEIDAVQKVIEKNVESTFKTFG